MLVTTLRLASLRQAAEPRSPPDWATSSLRRGGAGE
jgi:hypothetical protein